MTICEYGCGQEATYQFKNGKWCCCNIWQQCPAHKEIVKKQVMGENNPMFGKKHSSKTKEMIRLKVIGRKSWNKGISRRPSTKKKISEKLLGREPWNKGKINVYSKETLKKMTLRIVTKETREKLRNKAIITIDQIVQRYPFFSKIEEMRYNPEAPHEIQVHCKNHNCKNSKEQDGWFTPTYLQLYERIRQIEKDYGNGGSYLYCCEKCKNECPLYNLQSDPFKLGKKEYYTKLEYQQFREHVLERDNYKCQYCGEKAEHVHHERPQKLEPFFALDPDYVWSCCEKCHYEKGHKDECSTGKLANIICI